jgi:hypothetical protein
MIDSVWQQIHAAMAPVIGSAASLRSTSEACTWRP